MSEKDFPKLFEILDKAADGNLKDVSVLQIWGGPASGRSTLIEVIRSLSHGDIIRFDKHSCDPISYFWGEDMLPLQKEVACCHESRVIGEAATDVLNRVHLFINQKLSVVICIRWGDRFNMNVNATVIVSTSEPHVITGRKSDGRHPMFLHLPNRHISMTRFSMDYMVQKCLDEFRELRGRREVARSSIAAWILVARSSSVRSVIGKDMIFLIAEEIWAMRFSK